MERLVDLVTPLGDALWFRQMTGTEALSLPFELDVVMHSKSSGLSAKAVLGKPFTLKVATEQPGVQRFFNGICTRFASAGREGEHLIYTAKLRPWLWLASRRSDCKIFQKMKVPDIISEVLSRYGYPLTKKLTKSYRTWEYCVQYQETDLNFVMRLMEHEGIYFYFEHADGVHTMMLADDMSCHSPMAGKSTIKYFGLDAAAVADEEHINSWLVREEVDSGEYFSDDYDFEHPKADLKIKRANPLGHSHDAYQQYQWPGGYVEHGDGETYAGVRLDTLEAEHERTQAHTNLRTMAPGYRFTLARCPRADQNREYLALAATYYFRDNARMSAGSGAGDADWSITVSSQPTVMPYKPQPLTPKPRTHGPQTALVVGPKGEEIYTDKYGRIKVQFYWDRVGTKDENSSCWIRVATPWAGEKWGMIHIPRIGQEVVVDFIGGDPDYPLVTGSVYNADQMPPYGLPDNRTASGVKSRSTKGGGATDFNEIRMEDKKGEEQLYIHAQKNYATVVELDEARTVGQDRATRINRDDDRFVKNDDRHVIEGNHTEQIQKNQSVKVKGNQNNTVDGDQSNVVHGNRTQSVDGNQNEETSGNHLESVQGNHALTVSGDENNSILGNQTNFVQSDRTAIIMGSDNYATTGKTSLVSMQGYSVTTEMEYAETATQRSAMIYATDETTIGGTQTETIGASRSTTVGASDTTNIAGSQVSTIGVSQTTTVGTALTATAGGTVSITGGGTVTVTAGGVVTITGGGLVTISGSAITLNAPLVTCAGTLMATAVISPFISPCPTNKV